MKEKIKLSKISIVPMFGIGAYKETYQVEKHGIAGYKYSILLLCLKYQYGEITVLRPRPIDDLKPV